MKGSSLVIAAAFLFFIGWAEVVKRRFSGCASAKDMNQTQEKSVEPQLEAADAARKSGKRHNRHCHPRKRPQTRPETGGNLGNASTRRWISTHILRLRYVCHKGTDKAVPSRTGAQEISRS